MKSTTKLQKLYNENSLITDAIKSEAWEIRGITGHYFRSIVTGFKTNKKPFPEDEILGCISAIEQAYKNDLSRRKQFASKIKA